MAETRATCRLCKRPFADVLGANTPPPELRAERHCANPQCSWCKRCVSVMHERLRGGS